MKKINISRPSAPRMDEFTAEIADIWETRIFTNTGIKLKKLQSELQTYLNVPFISIFANGHSALESALEAMQLRGEVITTPFTFASTVQAIIRRGLTPVFCDINEKDYTIDAQAVEAAITEKTCAILPVHVYGNICDVKSLDEIAHKKKIPIIYDAAHAFGITKDGVGIGNYGDVSMFSFHATKIFHTIEGGGLTYHNSDYQPILEQIRNFGLSEGEVVRLGANYKMSEIHAAMGLCNIRNIDSHIKNRKRCTDRYNERLANAPGLVTRKEQQGVEYNYSYYPLRIVPSLYGRTRDELLSVLGNAGITARAYYFPLVSDFPIYDSLPTIKKDTPVASRVSSEILVLPLFSDMEIAEVDMICEVILKN